MRTKMLAQICLVLLIASVAITAQADPIITVTSDLVGPIGCTDTATFTVRYDPNEYEAGGGPVELWGFGFVLENDAGGIIDFGPDDVTNMGWPGIFLPVQVGDQVKVDGGTFDTETLLEATDLFSIVVHGTSASGFGELNIVSVSLKRPGNINIPVTDWFNPMATIEVDCTPPDAPEMVAEPPYTAGTENTVYWNPVADAVEYNVEIVDGAASGWFSGTDYLFDGLVHNTLYQYRVQARDGVGNEGPFSDPVESTQDAVTPESAVGAMADSYGTWFIDVPWTASDDMSGVAYVQLRFRIDGGLWDDFELTHTNSPIHFVASVDGVYDFYTIATDNAGNAEVNPEGDMVQVIVDTTAPDAPVMLPEPEYTQGTTNTVYWEAVPDATDYFVACTNGTVSGWITGLEYTFGGLEDAHSYSFQVLARDALNNQGAYSAPPVTSIQDDTAPTSFVVVPPSGNIAVQVFDIEVASADATSGVMSVRLFYNMDGTTWVQFGDGFAGPIIPFVAPADGAFEFYTIAEDYVGNVEEAPPVPDLVLTVDTAGPSGTFVINEGAEYTTATLVTLNCAYDDANDVVAMRFRNAGDGWGAWVPYTETYENWPLEGSEGVNTVEAGFEDGTGQVTETSDTIILDTVAPEPVSLNWSSGLVAGHQMVNITWGLDPADLDLDTVEIWAALWDDLSDGLGESTYPEYSDVHGAPGTSVPPTPETLGLDEDYLHIASVTAGDLTYVHGNEVRGAYSYYLFAKDNAGNYSAPQANWPRKMVNYILGDFDEDGEIGLMPDVSPFAGAYGTREVLDVPEPGYDGVFDIGPVSGGVPTTDNEIGFQDLMVLATNYQAQSGSKAATGDSQTPVLTWYQVDELNWALGLVDPCNSLKGIRLSHGLPENATVQYDLSLAIKGSPSYFLANNDRNGLDLGFAVLGNNSVFPGNGEILTVTTSEALDLTNVIVQVRDANNEAIEFELKAEPLVVLPTVYTMNANYPNPFNPQTTIKFALPDAQDVRLEIYNIKGQRVRVLVSESMSAGVHSVVWNGTDGSGRMVASGTYFYRIQAGPMNQTQRMLLLK